jgi:hypothetical protein
LWTVVLKKVCLYLFMAECRELCSPEGRMEMNSERMGHMKGARCRRQWPRRLLCGGTNPLR